MQDNKNDNFMPPAPPPILVIYKLYFIIQLFKKIHIPIIKIADFCHIFFFVSLFFLCGLFAYHIQS